MKNTGKKYYRLFLNFRQYLINVLKNKNKRTLTCQVDKTIFGSIYVAINRNMK